NSVTNCGYTICCRSNLTGNGTAGVFGSYNCDAAEPTVRVLLDFIQNMKPAPAFFVYVETYPTSSYDRLNKNTQTLLKSFGEQWSSMFHVLPDQLSTISKHAYYTALIMPGLRILAINPLYDYLYNVFAFRSELDPAKEEQRQFIRHTLQTARQNNEKNRDPDNLDKTTGVSLAAPSVTTYFGSNLGVNPSIRVYKMDSATFKPLDYDQYYISIPESNEKGVAEVKKHYTFTEEYQLADLSPSNFEALSNRIHTNWTEYQKFEANFYVLADDRPSCSKEDTLCRKRLTCQTRESKPLRYAACLLDKIGI
ncbi:unnamed protein product, partial [Candidula unifasciata]